MSSKKPGSDDDYDEDDFISFQYESQTISLYYSRLSKYSTLIRKQYVYSDVQNLLPKELHKLQEQFNIETSNIFYFFKLLQEGFNLCEKISFKQYTDFFKLAEFLQSKKILKILTDFFNVQKVDSDFAIQIILHEIENSKGQENYHFQINKQMEEILSEKVNECLQNDKFSRLPLHCLFRIVEKCDMKKLSMDYLYDFVKSDLNKFNILFSFMDLKRLSDDRISDLYERFSNNSIKPLFSYLKCNLDYIMELREDKKSNQGNQSLLQSEKEQLQIKVDELMKEKSQLEQDKSSLQKRLDDAERANKDLKEEIEKFKITGSIEAKLKRGLVFNAEIKLCMKEGTLNASMSKYIVSTSNSKSLDLSEYQKGEPISSINHFTTLDFAGKPGTYYVRALVVDIFGKSFELISNPVTISGENLSFDYEGNPRQIMLAKGKYKLEVWGGEGGSSSGSRRQNSPGQGGKGGYSIGTVSLSKCTKFYVFVGSKGKAANSKEGFKTEGAFPDGGGTMTGHNNSTYTSVPGTGGGSTSIRISSDSLYSRLIVAGGGGGADSDYDFTNNGGFGGGTKGGDGYYKGSVQCQGAGTQTGSTPGPNGSVSIGVAGTFGKGASSVYHGNCNTGGGGGGGWYGGGSGAYGNGIHSTSGGGGSGWIFTESSYNSWKSGDLANSGQYQLDSSFYLTNASTVAGDSSFPTPSGNGSEKGHSGNGYARITPE